LKKIKRLKKNKQIRDYRKNNPEKVRRRDRLYKEKKR
jgi:hypothetical protein